MAIATVAVCRNLQPVTCPGTLVTGMHQATYLLYLAYKKASPGDTSQVHSRNYQVLFCVLLFVSIEGGILRWRPPYCSILRAGSSLAKDNIPPSGLKKKKTLMNQSTEACPHDRINEGNTSVEFVLACELL